jgi:hypothetical protein
MNINQVTTSAYENTPLSRHAKTKPPYIIYEIRDPRYEIKDKFIL